MDKERLDILKKIHTDVRKNFRYKTDRSKHGVIEYWEPIPEDFKPEDGLVSDCEEFAFACRKLCMDAGFTATRLVICFIQNEGHMVLEVEGYVFCNNQTRLVTKNHLERKGYRWYAISGYNPGDPWHRL